MTYVPFTKLTAAQAKQAIRLRPKWNADDFNRMEFWVRSNGHVSKRAGHHQLTKEARAEIDAMLTGSNVTTKGSLAGYKTADFTLAPE